MIRAILRRFPVLAPWILLACGSSTPTAPCQPLPVDATCLAGPPSFVATVTQITHQQGMSPAGPLDQYNIWLAIPPSTVPNVGVVVGSSVPVFLQVGSGPPVPSTITAVQVGDEVAAWVSPNAAYGSVQAPPGAPAHFGHQLVILR